MIIQEKNLKVTFRSGKSVEFTHQEWEELTAYFTQQLMGNTPWGKGPILKDVIGIPPTQTPVQPTSPYNPWTVWY